MILILHFTSASLRYFIEEQYYNRASETIYTEVMLQLVSITDVELLIVQ